MDGHRRHLPCAFDQLEDADIALAQPVVPHKRDPTLAVEASGPAGMVAPDMPLVFSARPEQQDLTRLALQMISCKFTGDGLHKKHDYVSTIASKLNDKS